MHAFITIGSTEFDALIAEILSPRTLKALKARGYETLTVQCGNSVFDRAALVAKGETATLSLQGVAIELWKFKPSLREEYEKADLIVSHAGKRAALEIHGC
jgi:beta-1,4-N-acetylglucosaminyltransferase